MHDVTEMAKGQKSNHVWSIADIVAIVPERVEVPSSIIIRTTVVLQSTHCPGLREYRRFAPHIGLADRCCREIGPPGRLSVEKIDAGARHSQRRCVPTGRPRDTPGCIQLR